MPNPYLDVEVPLGLELVRGALVAVFAVKVGAVHRVADGVDDLVFDQALAVLAALAATVAPGVGGGRDGEEGSEERAELHFDV